jgi:hypothetical protein
LQNKIIILFLAILFGQTLLSQDLKNPLTLENEWPGYSIGDPYILKHRGVFYLYCSTKDRETGIKCWSSRDLVDWKYAGLCATDPVTRGAYAPEVIYWNGTFYMYTSPAGNGHYVLSGDSPTGPFEVISTNLGKSIDGSVFIDSDAKWYFYHASSQGIMGCEMSGPASIGADKNLNALMNNNWTEGPCVFRRNGKYYMIYTGNHVISLGYRIDYGMNNTGPINTYAPDENQNPILLNTLGQHTGLGHGSVFTGPDLDSYYLTYHNLVSGAGPFRRLNFDRIAWNGDKMVLLGPTEFAQQNPEMPDALDYFDRAETGSDWLFPTGGRWQIQEPGMITQDTTIDGDRNWFMAILDSTSSSDFTAEFNLKENYKDTTDGKLGAVFSYINERNYGVALLNSSTNSLEINFLTDNSWGTPELKTLPDQFDHSKWHMIRVERFNGKYSFFVDGMFLTGITGEKAGGRIGYLTSRCHGAFGFLAFSNKVNGSGTFDIYKPVPGKIPAVQYIEGGEGVGFHKNDTSAGVENILRMDEVELVESSLGGYGLASVKTNDWFSYAINVKQDGLHNVNIIYAANQEDCSIRLYLDGADISGALEIPSTGGNTTWRSFLVKDIELTGGNHLLRAEINSGTLHLYSLEIVPAENNSFDKTFSFDNTFDTGWKYTDGNWTLNNQNAYIDGYGKRTYGNSSWSDYMVETDIMFTRSMNAGIIFRVNNPARGGANDDPALGTDFLQGYFVGFNYGSVVLGKHNYGWESLKTSSGTFSMDTWYHLRVVVNRSRIIVYVDDMVNPRIDYTDPLPLINGMAGLRSFNTGVRYDNFHVTSDLLATSANEISGNAGQLKIHPNPSIESVNIYFSGREKRNIRMLDLQGTEVVSINSYDEHVVIPASGIKKGLYIIMVQSTSGFFTEKFILK